ncbi:probable membrane-associated kinase regulator 4 [Durio zibethinus]|uniref:Probable membrane-associated kinase regulator 4 n=1 Tax=Durio zibethinus TaxID=66656 RepID=A0A6P5YVH3_DURZI|nr:probable membrane-associated kinase regulator 4 [Durio zibethinus]
MEVSSYSNFFCNSISSPPHPIEFEFQMSSVSMERKPITSPADELFYKGKLLPLHLPPRLQMIKKLLQNSNSVYEDRKDNFEEFYSTPLTSTVTTPTTTSTPFESCNISPCEFCHVSRELNPEEYFFECLTQVSGCIGENPKKSWTKKFKLTKQSSIGSKLKASRAYLKSLFDTGCSNESCAAAKVAAEGSVSKAKERLDRYMKSRNKDPFGQIHQDKYQISTAVMRSFDEKKITENNANRHRRSFSLAIKRHSTNKSSSTSSSSGSSSSSCSNDSNGFQYLQFLKRSSSVNLETESPIQGAIAHCKQSQQLMRSRKTVS